LDDASVGSLFSLLRSEDGADLLPANVVFTIVTTMSIQRSLANRFKRLRWKLTLSYTGVTVGALLVVELVLLGAIGVGLIALLNSGFLPALLIEASSVDFAPALRPYLAQTPPDQAGIADWLDRVGNLTSLDVPLDFDATEEMLVVGSDGRLLGAKPPDLLGSDQIGQPLDPSAIPGLEDPLQAALAGDEEVEHLYTLASPGDRIVMVVPVWDTAHEQVLGALVGLGEAPTIVTLLGDMLPILGVSLLAFTLVAGLAGTAFGAQASRGLVDRLNALAEATLVWSQGDFTVRIGDSSGDEVGQLTHRLNQMARQLEHLLATRRELAVVEERNRLARDLHDSAKQRAFAAAAQIGAARALLKQDPNAAETHIAEAERLSYELRQELTNLIQELRPAALEGKGLASAVREYTEDWSRQNRIALDVRVQGERSLPLDTEQAIFRIVQEALANIARHSKARTADIKLAYTSDEIHCAVSDDGIGFDPDRQRSGFGLRSMQERAEALRGNLTIESVTGQGARIVLSAPLGKSPG
jgi:NarL family two-component system sensor histidine kinase LiaS